ncbi:MAG TPA: Fe-S-containing protein [Candidatus Binataceae bacterium]|nr:Fe-S-containing protein [Candidatus Binataceae bacterium]
MRRPGPKKLAVGALIATVAIVAALPILRPRCIELRGAEALTVSLARLEGGEARLFCYRDRAGERLRFLLARGSDGKVRAVFDACRQCYKFHQGYDVAHGVLICRLCGNRYPIDHMMKGEASCVPVSLPHHEDASRVEIKVSDLKSGAALF